VLFLVAGLGLTPFGGHRVGGLCRPRESILDLDAGLSIPTA
jgi:hypothetical protein